jgi:ketol-acid reductoisomerase
MTDERQPTVRVYRTSDAPPDALRGEAVAVLGYGNLGRTAALNLRDSGLSVRIGNREDEYAARARADGFQVVPLAAAASDDIVFVLLPDEVIPVVFEKDMQTALHAGTAVAFASGYCLAFGLVHPPEGVDVLLLAPRMSGVSARARYLAGEGFWACVGVEANRSGRARDRLLSLAGALGVLGAIEMSASVEATLDLFVEQTAGVLFGAAIMTAFDVGRAAGLPAEALVMEMYMSGEMESVFRGFRETGFIRSSRDHGPTAVFGGALRMIELDREAIGITFQRVLDDIKSGGFARRFQDEAGNGYPVLGMVKDMIRGTTTMTEAEERLRGLTPSPGPSTTT